MECSNARAQRSPGWAVKRLGLLPIGGKAEALAENLRAIVEVVLDDRARRVFFQRPYGLEFEHGVRTEPDQALVIPLR